MDRTPRPLASCRITRVEPPLGTTIPCPPVGRFSSTPEYAVTSRKVAAIPRTYYIFTGWAHEEDAER